MIKFLLITHFHKNGFFPKYTKKVNNDLTRDTTHMYAKFDVDELDRTDFYSVQTNFKKYICIIYT